MKRWGFLKWMVLLGLLSSFDTLNNERKLKSMIHEKKIMIPAQYLFVDWFPERLLPSHLPHSHWRHLYPRHS